MDAGILADMAGVIEHKIYLAAGYSSMLKYSTEHLGYDGDAARQRITAAGLLLRFPAIGPMVASGALHLAALRLLGPKLTETNHRKLLTAAKNKSKRQIEEMLAALRPSSDVLPLPGPAPRPATDTSCASATRGSATTSRAPSAARTKPLSADSFSITFTIDRACYEKLMQAKALLGHAVPSGDVGTIVERGLDLLLAKQRKRKFGVTDKPRPGSAAAAPTDPDSRYIKAADRREVHARDGERCAFVGFDGKRCNETMRLELHRCALGARRAQKVATWEFRCGERSCVHGREPADGHTEPAHSPVIAGQRASSPGA